MGAYRTPIWGPVEFLWRPIELRWGPIEFLWRSMKVRWKPFEFLGNPIRESLAPPGDPQRGLL
eukprot:5571458-Pyramimonas_sp.AAC.1